MRGEKVGGGQDIHLVVCQANGGWREENPVLLRDLRTRYYLDNVGDKVKVEFCTLKKLREDLGVTRRKTYKEDLPHVIRSYFESRVGGGRMVFMVDEMDIGDGDWTIIDDLVEKHDKLRLVVSIRPLDRGKKMKRLPKKHTLVQELSLQYRYCRENQQFGSFVNQRTGNGQTSAPENESSLPEGGKLPVLIEVPDNKIMEGVERAKEILDAEQPDLHVTLLIDRDNDDIKEGIKENGEL